MRAGSPIDNRAESATGPTTHGIHLLGRLLPPQDTPLGAICAHGGVVVGGGLLVEILVTEECPACDQAVALVAHAAVIAGVRPRVVLVEVADLAAAVKHRFVGYPRIGLPPQRSRVGSTRHRSGRPACPTKTPSSPGSAAPTTRADQSPTDDCPAKDHPSAGRRAAITRRACRRAAGVNRAMRRVGCVLGWSDPKACNQLRR